MSSTKRKCLTLEERMKALKMLESGRSCRAVATEMGVSKTQKQSVMKRKQEIIEEYDGNLHHDLLATLMEASNQIGDIAMNGEKVKQTKIEDFFFRPS